MKRLFNLFPIFLIILGSILEIYYYNYRFTMDGINIYISLTISLALTLLLTILSKQYKSKIVFLLIVPLAVYSIFTTSAGQAFSLGEKYNEETIEQAQQLNKQSEIEYYQNKIIELNSEYKNLETQKNNTITSLEDRWNWKNTLAKLEERQSEIKTEISNSEKIISKLRPELTINKDIEKQETNIYKFYNNLFGLNMYWLQFILQTILSFFICVMSPIGIIILTTKKPEPKQQPRKRQQIPKKKPDTRYYPFIEKWVNISWIPYRKKTSNKIVDKKAFVEWMRKRYKSKKESILFTTEIYDKIFSAAVKKNIVDKLGIIIYTGTEDKIISILKEHMNNEGTIKRT